MMEREDRFAVFRARDHAGFRARAVMAAVDVCVLGFLSALSFLGFAFAAELTGARFLASVWQALFWFAIPFVYLTVVKRSRLRTLGYLLAGYTVVSVTGDRPSLRQMTVRLAVTILESPPVTLLTVPQGRFGQAISDEVAGTLVVRAGARPVGWLRRSPRLLFFNRHTYFVDQPILRNSAP